MTPVRILLTACGAPGAPGIIRSLRANGERDLEIVGTDMNPTAVGFSLVDRGYCVPPGDVPGFLDGLQEVIRNELPVHAILPLSTNELLPLSTNMDVLRSYGVGAALSPPESLSIANDKAKLYAFFDNTTVPVPRHELVRDVDGFREAARVLGYPDRTVCFKPAVSRGSRGFRIIENRSDRLDRLFSEKPESVYTDFEAMVSILSQRRRFPDSLVMEYIPGAEYSVDCLVDNGRQLVAIPRLRQEMRHGISYRATTERNEEIIGITRLASDKLSLHGNIGFQIRMDSEGRPHLIEVNPRLQGTVVLCTAAGVNLPYFGLKLALGESIAMPSVKWGVSVSRFWSEMFYDENGRPYTL